MEIINVRIEGVASLLQHRFTESSEAEATTRRSTMNHGTPREQAEKAAYRTPTGELYLPGAAIARLLREVGVGHKQRSSRKSLKWIIPAAVIVLQDAIPLLDGEDEVLKDFEIDSRPVTIPSTKGRIMRHRPRLDSWAAAFDLQVDEQVLDADTIHMLLEEGGRTFGVGDFRPEKGGPFGRFAITRWDRQRD